MMRLAPVVACWFGCAALTGCATLPDLSAGRADPGPAATLVPIEGILAQADALGAAEQAAGQLDARANRLKARASQLRSQ